MTDNSGLKVGMGTAIIGGAGLYTAKPMVNKMTKIGINIIKDGINSTNEVIKASKDTMIKYAEYAGQVNAKGNIYDWTKKTYINALINKKELYDQATIMFKLRKAAKNINAKKALALAIPFYLGCGAIVDFANRKQRANNAPNATTKNGNEYTKVNMGKKLGAFLGLAVGAAHMAINRKDLAKVLKMSPNKTISVAFSLLNGAIGGLALGAIADKISNNKAAKEADKAAEA